MKKSNTKHRLNNVYDRSHVYNGCKGFPLGRTNLLWRPRESEFGYPPSDSQTRKTSLVPGKTVVLPDTGKTDEDFFKQYGVNWSEPPIKRRPGKGKAAGKKERRETRVCAPEGAKHETPGVVGDNESSVTQSPLEKSFDIIADHYELHGFNFNRISAKDKTLKHWRQVCGELGGEEKGWLKFLKYKLPAYFACWLGNKPAPAPFKERDDPRRLISSRQLDRQIRRILLKEGKRIGVKMLHFDYLVPEPSQEFETARQCIVGLNYIKKGLPRPDESELKKNLEETAKILFGEPKEDTSSYTLGYDDEDQEGERCVQETTIDRARLVFEIRRTVGEVFANQHFSYSDAMKMFSPSLRANTSYGVDECGMFGLLNHDQQFQTFFRGLAPVKRVVKVWDEEKGDGGGWIERVCLSLDREMLSEVEHHCFEYCLWRARAEIPVVEPVGLPEPLKVRVITKEPGFLMFVLKSLQNWMWTVLSRHPTFILLKHPKVTPGILSAIGKLAAGEKYLSGDYSAATNLLRSWASDAVADELRSRFAPSLLRNGFFGLFQISLTKHLLDNRDSFWPGLPSGILPQVNGQLMGSVSSFPVLCLVNAAFCRLVIELDRRAEYSMSLRQCEMLVNGDDCLFRVGERGYEAWLECGDLLGLVPSPGKFYYCSHYVNINSTSFFTSPEYLYVDEDRGEDHFLCVPKVRTTMTHWRLCKFVNWGLIFGMKRAKEGSLAGGLAACSDTIKVSINRAKTWSAVSFELKEFTPETLFEKVYDLFINTNIRPYFSDCGVPWFVPESFGGLGLLNTPKHQMTDTDRQLCWVLNDSKDLLRKIRPLTTFAKLPVWNGIVDMVKEEKMLDEIVKFEGEEGFAAVERLEDEAKGDFLRFAVFLLNVSAVESDSDDFIVTSKLMNCFCANRRVWRSLGKRTSRPSLNLAKTFDPWTVTVPKRALALHVFGDAKRVCLRSDFTYQVKEKTSVEYQILRKMSSLCREALDSEGDAELVAQYAQEIAMLPMEAGQVQ